MSFNKIIIMGNLTADWELKYTPKGTAVAKVNVAVNRKWQTEAGEAKEEVAFIPVEAWGRSAEALAQYTRKGDPLLLEGRVAQENWEDKATQKPRSRLKVVLETFSFIKQKDSGDRSAPARQPTAREQARGQAAGAEAAAPEDDDQQIPF